MEGFIFGVIITICAIFGYEEADGYGAIIGILIGTLMATGILGGNSNFNYLYVKGEE